MLTGEDVRVRGQKRRMREEMTLTLTIKAAIVAAGALVPLAALDVVLLERDERRDARALEGDEEAVESPASVIASTKEGIALGVVIVLPVKEEERHSRGDVPGGPAVDAWIVMDCDGLREREVYN